MSNQQKTPRLIMVGVGVLMVAAAVMTGWVTRHGVGFPADAVDYTSAARTFAAHRVLQVPDNQGGLEPLSHYPPLYSLMLGAAGQMNGDVLAVARWVDLVLFPLNVLLLAWLAHRMGIMTGAVLVVCALFTLAPDILLAHVSVRSETLALTGWLTGLLLLLEWSRRKTWGWLMAAAAMASLVMLTRYVGAALILAGALFVFFYSTGGGTRKIGHGISYLLIAVFPTLAWMVTHPSSRGAADRQFGFYGLTNYQYGKFFGAFARWMLPFNGHSVEKAIYIGLLLVLLAMFVALLSRGGGRVSMLWAVQFSDRVALVLLLLNLAAYEAVVFLSGIFLDPVQDVSSRMQILPFVFVLLLLGVAASALAQNREIQWTGCLRRLAVSLVALLVGGYVCGAATWLRGADQEELGDNNAGIRQSAAIALLRGRYGSVPVYTNYSGRIYYFTGRTDFYLTPFPRLKARNDPNLGFAAEQAKMLADLVTRHGVIIYFKDTIPKMSTAEEMEETPSLKILADFPDAVILVATSDGK